MSDDAPKPLLVLAAHAAGDFPLQTDRMAAEKFDSRSVRAAHVAVYTAAFVPAVVASDWTVRQSAAFLATVAVTHFAVDSQRWYESTEQFPTRSLWFDQALHVIALGLATLLGGRTVETGGREAA